MDKTNKSDALESRERTLNEQLARSNHEIGRLKEALDCAESRASEAGKLADDMRGKYHDAQLKLHEVSWRKREGGREGEKEGGRERGSERVCECVRERKGRGGRESMCVCACS